MMIYLLSLALLVLLLQIVLFFRIKKRNKGWKEEDVLLKYNINSRSDAWRALSDPELPMEDREKIRQYYEATE